MNKRAQFDISLKIVGIYFLIDTLANIPVILSKMFLVLSYQSLRFIDFWLLILPILAYILTMHSGKIARIIVRDDNKVTDDSQSSLSKNIITISMYIVGGLSLLWGLKVFVRSIDFFFTSNSNSGNDMQQLFLSRMPEYDPTSLIVPAIQLLLGLLLLFKARGIARHLSD